MRQDLLTKTDKTARLYGWAIIEGHKIGEARNFKRGEQIVWPCIHKNESSWCRAIAIHGQYCDHTYNSDLCKLLSNKE